MHRTSPTSCTAILLGVILSFIPLIADERSIATSADSEGSHAIPEEAVQFIRGIALLLLPDRFEDDDGWGEQTKVQSGLDWDWDDGRLETRRRWKSVNHGSWLQASGELVDPATTFQLRATRIADSPTGAARYDIRATARLRVTARQQQWSYGVRLWSISADAIADVSLLVIVDVDTQLESADSGTTLRIVPTVTHAVANLDSFDVRRVSHIKGAAVQELAGWIEKLIQRRVDHESRDLAVRINKALSKLADRLEVPFEVGSWLVVPAPQRDGIPP